MIHRVADFSGIEVVTYCVMSNHFLVLIRIDSESKQISDGELVRRYRSLYPSGGAYQQMKPHVLEELLSNGGEEARGIRERMVKRMGDVSEYMKTLKQRFTVYYNQNHQRFGTLWAERFKSVLVEPENKTILAMSAYIDLNPVRAGLVKDPKDYRFCGYAEALAGGIGARRGVAMALMGYPGKGGRKALAQYRMVLYGVGAQATKEGVRVLDKEKTLSVLEKEKGRVPLSALLRCRLRYFTDGMVLGSQVFLESRMKRENARLRQVPIAEEDGVRIFVGKGFRGAVVS